MLKVIIALVLITNAIFTYLVVLGASKNKTDEERKIDDEEQMKYLENYKNGGK